MMLRMRSRVVDSEWAGAAGADWPRGAIDVVVLLPAPCRYRGIFYDNVMSESMTHL
jgi:hypothetical protein